MSMTKQMEGEALTASLHSFGLFAPEIFFAITQTICLGLRFTQPVKRSA